MNLLIIHQEEVDGLQDLLGKSQVSETVRKQKLPIRVAGRGVAAWGIWGRGLGGNH